MFYPCILGDFILVYETLFYSLGLRCVSIEVTVLKKPLSLASAVHGRLHRFQLGATLSLMVCLQKLLPIRVDDRSIMAGSKD